MLKAAQLIYFHSQVKISINIVGNRVSVAYPSDNLFRFYMDQLLKRTTENSLY